MNVFIDFVVTILLHECIIKQVCKTHFTIDPKNTKPWG